MEEGLRARACCLIKRFMRHEAAFPWLLAMVFLDFGDRPVIFAGNVLNRHMDIGHGEFDVAMAQKFLDDRERNSFTDHFGCEGMAEAVGFGFGNGACSPVVAKEAS